MAFYPTFIASYMKETWLALDTQPGFSTLWGLPQNLHSATDPFKIFRYRASFQPFHYR